ncbi:hypothetical protein AZI86_11330 [Bdellovibrio bacteriovorus]|uniref:Uncharacterized protein n=1 Tax=Bdellovibrio bacteriovorus TaxID=959 RepID=A0A150WLA9_BDEBC|nr:hypothetical protein [Bdellovibrio bacteriovorus]KYG64789.1 hypothetical protein AZI86_11330 [Bdellovibrio bacteriovorus]
MKKMVLAAMSMALLGSVSYANDFVTENIDNSYVYEQEEGAMSPEAIEMLSPDGMHVFGATEIQSWPRRPGPDRPGRPGRPGGPGYGHPGRPGPRPPQYVTCFARNARGEMFRATANDPRWAQRMAMDKCERFSRFCRPAGCR